MLNECFENDISQLIFTSFCLNKYQLTLRSKAQKVITNGKHRKINWYLPFRRRNFDFQIGTHDILTKFSESSSRFSFIESNFCHPGDFFSNQDFSQEKMIPNDTGFSLKIINISMHV